MHLIQRNSSTAVDIGSNAEGGSVSTLAMPLLFNSAATRGLEPRTATTEILTREELADVDDVLLKRVAEIWRAQGLRGDAHALRIATGLEIELRRRIVSMRDV